jgi:hypothetical protein
MVKSILDKTVEYAENPAIEQDDLNYEASLYQVSFLNKAMVFALGQPKYTYKGLVYYPIYLSDTQIGVYEILSSAQPNILDEDGDVDLNKLPPPLFYKKFIISQHPKPHWLQQFFQNPSYNIIESPRDGHSLFAALKSALPEKVNIDRMRQFLSKNATEELFQKYKTMYEDVIADEEALTRQIKNITERYNALSPKIKTTKDRNLQMSFIEQLNVIKNRHGELKKERLELKIMAKEIEFMKGIADLSQLKLVMLTPKYMADAWAISILERELNIKTIVLSEMNYLEGDELNVLNCGQASKMTKFEPSFYVLLCNQGGGHYQLINYANKSAFTFPELPAEIKTLVKEKCLERNAGLYSLIPEFSI